MIGYARVSTNDQDISAQIARLETAGCEIVWSDVLSGTRASRPQWDACLKSLNKGDQLDITKLDRAGRSLKHLMALSEQLDERGITLKVIDQAIDTSTSAGRALFQMLGVFAEFERNLISERTKEALRGRPRGRSGGRPKALTDAWLKRAQDMYDAKTMTVPEIAGAVKCSASTLYRHLTLDTANAD
ncbi:MAG: recombinase family protein [Actinomycetales bacterium]|nr:recombinase family protein [Actinomycetales bacterium]